MSTTNKKKIQAPPVQSGGWQQGSASKGASAGLNPVKPVVSTQGVSSPKQSSSSSYSSGSRSTTVVRPGVSAATLAALSGYTSGYKPGADVQAAQQYLQQIQGQKPGDYKSPYLQQLGDIMSQIQGRKPFSYDLNADMLYQQYKDQYQNLGQQAMMDTMGQAAGLTGGYGSSYGQNVGQQAYNSYLQQLNDKIPDLYRLALDKYNAEGDEMYKQYGLLSDRENAEYGKWRDRMSDWRQDLANAQQRYDTDRNFDYGKWSDMFGYWQNQADRENNEWWKQTEYDYQQNRDKIADEQWQKNFDYQAQRDKIADSQWQKEFNAQQAYRAQQIAASQAAAAARAAAKAEKEAAKEDSKKGDSSDYDTFDTPIRIHGTPLNSMKEIGDYLAQHANEWSMAEFERVRKDLLRYGISIQAPPGWTGTNAVYGGPTGGGGGGGGRGQNTNMIR